MKNDTATDKTNNTDSLDKKLSNINMVSLESDNMTNEIFGMIASVRKTHCIKLN